MMYRTLYNYSVTYGNGGTMFYYRNTLSYVKRRAKEIARENNTQVLTITTI